MNLLYFSFFIFCFVTLAQLITYIMFISKMPKEVKNNPDTKEDLKNTANKFILPFYGCNLLLIIILFICKSMNSTKWWFMFWTILLAVLPAGWALYIIVENEEIKHRAYEFCICTKQPEEPGFKCPEDKKYKSNEITQYCDALVMALLVICIVQIIAVTFYFLSLYHNHDFRKIQPDVVYIVQPVEPLINTITTNPQNNRMNNSQPK